MTETLRIAMWSGPRNISTAMMRSFSARDDTSVVDEPFYAAYLAATGLDHPLRQAVLDSQPHDPQLVIARLLETAPNTKRIYYQKHMSHHMLPSIDRSWLAQVTNAFLLREPRAVLASYVQARSQVTLADIGIVQQHELFDRVADQLGHAPPVIESADILADPPAALHTLCGALGIHYTPAMLHWRAGRHPQDGVWAPAWYAQVERSTGFDRPPPRAAVALPAELEHIAQAAAPHYRALLAHRLVPHTDHATQLR